MAQQCELKVMFGINDTVRKILAETGMQVKSGDTRVNWDPEKPKEVDLAETAFNKLRAEGYNAFRIRGADMQGEKMETFDPQAGKVIMVAPIAGG